MASLSASKKYVPSNPQKQISIHYDLKVPRPSDWSLIFESYPVWFFSLNPTVVKTIHLPRFQDWTTFQAHIIKQKEHGIISLYDAFVSFIGRRKLKFGCDHEASLSLVSGSLSFATKYLENKRGLGLLDRFFRGK